MESPPVVFRSVTQLKVQAHLHGKALVAAGDGAAERPLALVVPQDVTVQIEAAAELLLTAVPGTRQPSPLPGVSAHVVQVTEPGVVEELLALCARHLCCTKSAASGVHRLGFSVPPQPKLTFVFSPVSHIFRPGGALERAYVLLTDVTCVRENEILI